MVADGERSPLVPLLLSHEFGRRDVGQMEYAVSTPFFAESVRPGHGRVRLRKGGSAAHVVNPAVRPRRRGRVQEAVEGTQTTSGSQVGFTCLARQTFVQLCPRLGIDCDGLHDRVRIWPLIGQPPQVFLQGVPRLQPHRPLAELRPLRTVRARGSPSLLLLLHRVDLLAHRLRIALHERLPPFPVPSHLRTRCSCSLSSTSLSCLSGLL